MSGRSTSSVGQCSSAASAVITAAIAAVTSSSAVIDEFAGPSTVVLGWDHLLPSASELDHHLTSGRYACGCRPSGHLGCSRGCWDASGPWGDHPESSHVGHRDRPSLGAAAVS